MRHSGILVRPPRPTGPIVLLGFGLLWSAPCLLATVGSLRANQLDHLYFWIPALLIGFLIGLASAGWWMLELSRRRWLEITPEGFTLKYGNSVKQVSDDQVLSASSTWKPFHFNGSLWSTTRTFHLWIAQAGDEIEKISLVCKIKPLETDPLIPLMERLIGKLYAQACSEFESGQIVYGEGWALDQRTLRVTLKNRELVEIAVDHMEAVDFIDGEICIWTLDRDEVVAKISMETANTFILNALIANTLREKKVEPKAPEEKGRLGRLIFERTSTRKEFVVYLLVGIVILGISIPMLVANAWGAISLGWALLTLCLGLFSLGAAFNASFAFFRCHLFGVHRRWLFSEKKLRYDAMEGLTFTSLQHFHHGMYGGTQYSICFDPILQEKSKRIAYHFHRQVNDREIDRLRDQVASQIAAKMVTSVNQGQRTAWTKNVFFLPEGLEFQTTSFLLKKQTVILPYEEIGNHFIREGHFHLLSYENGSVILKLNTSLKNFFPGLIVLEELRSSPPIAP